MSAEFIRYEARTFDGRAVCTSGRSREPERIHLARGLSKIPAPGDALECWKRLFLTFVADAQGVLWSFANPLRPRRYQFQDSRDDSFPRSVGSGMGDRSRDRPKSGIA